jgi:DNA polymerase III delta prime subunit
MEQASDTCRFICTCNYVNKILPAIQSRMQVMQFKAPDQESLIGRLVEMLVIENVDFDENDLILYLQQAYPDVRKIINNLQLNTVDGKLLSPKDDSGNGDYKFELIKHIHECDIASIRKMLATQIPSEEIESLYEVLYQNLTSIKGVNKNSAIMDKLILVIADHLRSHAISAFPYITMESCLIKMMMVINEEI